MLKRCKVFFFFLIFILTAYPAHAAKGGIYILDNLPPPGGEYATSGSVIVDWRDLEPREGEYHWELLNNPDIAYNPWHDVFLVREGRDGTYPKPAPAMYFRAAHNSGKKLRFKVRVTEGAMPVWLFGGQDGNEPAITTSYGSTCAYKDLQQAHDLKPDCHGAEDIVIAQDYPLYPKKEESSEPVWWNKNFKEKYKKFLIELGKQINANPMLYESIEFVEASLGSYGETILYGKVESITDNNEGPSQILFKGAGYNNALYVNTVLDLLSYYVQAFPSLPIALSLGNGLYPSAVDDGSGVTTVEGDITRGAMTKFGSRVYLKFAGFGAGGNRRTATFGTYCPKTTRCIYESMGGITGWTDYPWHEDYRVLENYLKAAPQDKAYILMIWWGDVKDLHAYHPDLKQAFFDIVPMLEANGAIEPDAPPVIPTPDLSTPKPSPTPTKTPTPTKKPTPTPYSTPGIQFQRSWNMTLLAAQQIPSNCLLSQFKKGTISFIRCN